MLFPILRFLFLLALASVPGGRAVAAESENAVHSTDAIIVASEGERAKFYAEASYEKAITASLRGYGRAVELGSREDQMLFLRHLTFDNWLLGNSTSAIEHGLRLLRLTEETESVVNRSRANRYLSQIYHSLGDNTRAEKYAQAALVDADRLDQGNLRAYARECLGLCALSVGDFPLARRELAAALAHFQAAGQLTSAFVVRREQGDLAAAEGDLAGALAIYEEVVSLSTARGNPLSVARALDGTARLLRLNGRPAEALARLERARPLVATVGGHPLRQEFFTELALTHEALGEFAPALAAHRTAAEARDAMAGVQARVRAAEVESNHELELKQQAIERLGLEKAQQAAELRARGAELRRAHDVRSALTVGAIAAAVAFGAIFISQRARLRAERGALEETRRAQVLAEDAGVLKTRLLAVASHDLKGPLRSIVRGAESITQQAADPVAVAASAQLVRGNAERMFELVRDLLDLAAIEGGNLQLQKTTFDLGQLAGEVANRHASRAAEKGQTLVVDPSGEGGLQVFGDMARLAQAVDNLVDNAVKYTPPGGTIRVSVVRRSSHVHVAVADEGPGLGPDDLARMFQPFQRLSATPTGGESSTGLGLHITRDFVARHDGSVEVDSAPGRGTTFTIVLPAGNS